MNDDVKVVLTFFAIGAIVGAVTLYVIGTVIASLSPVYTIPLGFVAGGLSPFLGEGI